MSNLVLVTGAAGHLGGAVVRALLAQRRRVRALVHSDARALHGLDVEVVHGDIRSEDDMRRTLRGVGTVLHLAARISITGDPDGSVHAVNVGGTRTVLDAARRAGVRRLVHCSSVHAFRPPPPGMPLNESSSLQRAPGAPAYDRSKAEAQLLVEAAAADGLNAVVVCPSAVLGPYDFKPSHMGRVLCALQEHRLPALVNGGFDWIDVRDVAAGILAAPDHGRRGASYLLGGHWATLDELARLAASCGDFRAPRLTVPMWIAALGAPLAAAWARLRGTEPLFTPESLRARRTAPLVDSGRARRELGVQARPLEDTVQDSLRWLREHGDGRRRGAP